MVTVAVRYVQGLNIGLAEVREEFETRVGAEAYVEMVLAKGLWLERPAGGLLIVPPHRTVEIEVWGEEVSTDGETDKRMGEWEKANLKPHVRASGVRPAALKKKRH